MELGFALPYAGRWATPANQATVARRAEELGWSCLWTSQRLLYPDSPRDSFPAAPGPTWPATIRSVVDPITPLAYVAALTSRIRLGTCSLMLPLFSPVLLAKQLATLDVLSGGRLDVGVSLGWSQDEYAAVGTPFVRRGARFDAYLEALVATWTGEAAANEFVTLPPGEVLPAPVQRPHPPLFVGGYTENALRRAVRFGRGHLVGSLPLDRVPEVRARLSEFALAGGRDPAELALVCRGVTVVTAAPMAPGGKPLTGTVEQIAADVERYAAAGVDHLFLDLNFDPAVGTLDSDPAAALDTALAVLEGVTV
ncbi:TIGR03619 family F420-dependent LLM class oxidoreductase [Sporichthya brevicatena]|uniref:TIGR03619 family F420-dependent LLM class oxidoreductase n=1 Tax=Sporichthya brevicatena TaxID=171442 RepID=A0ABN1H3J1_9ACTN